MRALTLAVPLGLLVLLGSATTALPQGDQLVATGRIQFSDRACTHDLSRLVIERGYSGEDELLYVGTGTGVLSLGSTDPSIKWNYVPYQTCGNGWVHFGGGQCFECEGSCRILEDGTAECWDGGYSTTEPPPTLIGLYLRLDPNGSLYYSYRGSGLPWDPDVEAHGQMTRV